MHSMQCINIPPNRLVMHSAWCTTVDNGTGAVYHSGIIISAPWLHPSPTRHCVPPTRRTPSGAVTSCDKGQRYMSPAATITRTDIYNFKLLWFIDNFSSLPFRLCDILLHSLSRGTFHEILRRKSTFQFKRLDDILILPLSDIVTLSSTYATRNFMSTLLIS